MTTLFLPQRFTSGATTVYFDGSTGITAQQAPILLPAVEDKTMQVAGGYTIDADYGARSNLRPQPFSFSVVVEAETAGSLNGKIAPLLNYVTGLYGASGTFYAFKHNAPAALFRCTARLIGVSKELDHSDMSGPFTATIIDNLTLRFSPSTIFTEV